MLKVARTAEQWVEFLLENSIENDFGCYLCHLLPNAAGYSNLSLGGRFGKKWRAHRLVYSIYVEPIPEGLLVLHSCDNRRCINPKHLFLGTEKDNTQDMMAKGRNKFKISRFVKPEQDRKLLLEFYERGFTMMEIGNCLNIPQGTVFNYVSPKGAYYVPSDT